MIEYWKKISTYNFLVKSSAHLSRSQLKRPLPLTQGQHLWLQPACPEEVLPVISCILNSSLALGHFPSTRKDTLVDPRLKKTGKDILFSNLHPVSNFQFILKLAEGAVFNQVHKHMKFQLYPLLQSAYHTIQSTETALLNVHNDILLNMDNQRATLLILLNRPKCCI